MIAARQAWPLPTTPRPIVVIGAGAIVRTAHLPAYRRIGLPVAGVFDICREAAAETARQFGDLTVYPTFAAACDVGDAIFDLAVPAPAIAGVLAQLPRGAAVLIQKPMGETLSAARQIAAICRERQLLAAMNFQLRFSPNMMALADLIATKQLGDLTDIEVRIVDRQPWEQWTFLKGAPRLEVLYHSIHYLDAIRWIAGDPAGVMCRTASHPQLREFADTSSTIVLDFGARIRCSLVMNHSHRHDETHRASLFKVEGTTGAALLTLGVNLDYPAGPPDRMAVSFDRQWRPVALRGSWFSEAFEGPMANLQRVLAGEDTALVSPIADALKTMALVEACYASSNGASTPIPAA
jgi:predicted dehydrogenase